MPGYRRASLLQMNAFTRHCISNFHIELPTFIFRHERFSCRERITFMQTPLFYKHLVADHLTEKIIHCRSQEFSVISPGSLLSSTLSLKGEKGG